MMPTCELLPSGGVRVPHGLHLSQPRTQFQAPFAFRYRANNKNSNEQKVVQGLGGWRYFGVKKVCVLTVALVEICIVVFFVVRPHEALA
jgi:hypothetical protein